MKRLIFLVLLVSSFAKASTEDIKSLANINKGNAMVFGGANFSQTFNGNQLSGSMGIDIGFGYFLLPGLALGFSASADAGTNQKLVALGGPLAHYFFFKEETLGTYIQVRYLQGFTQTTIRGRVLLNIGLDFFLTTSVAFGPNLSFGHTFGRNSSDYDRVILGANFAIYL